MKCIYICITFLCYSCLYFSWYFIYMRLWWVCEQDSTYICILAYHVKNRPKHNVAIRINDENSRSVRNIQSHYEWIHFLQWIRGWQRKTRPQVSELFNQVGWFSGEPRGQSIISNGIDRIFANSPTSIPEGLFLPMPMWYSTIHLHLISRLCTSYTCPINVDHPAISSTPMFVGLIYVWFANGQRLPSLT